MVLDLLECPSKKSEEDDFLEKSRDNQIKEIHLRGGLGFLKDQHVLSFQEFFPHLEKLIVDQHVRCHGWELYFLRSQGTNGIEFNLRGQQSYKNCTKIDFLY